MSKYEPFDLGDYGQWMPPKSTPEQIERAVQNSLARERERETGIRADSAGPGKLEEIVTLNPLTGAVHYRDWKGPKSAWMDQFKAPGVRILRFDKNPRRPDFSMSQGGSGLTQADHVQLAVNYRDHMIAQQSGEKK